MFGFLIHKFRNLTLRWKLLAVVLPLVLIPIFIVGTLIGVIATQQSYVGITKAARNDLQHMADFTIDLLQAHYQQFEVYQADRREVLNDELETLTNLAHGFVEQANRLYEEGQYSKDYAVQQAKKAFKTVNIGESGYIYAMDTRGTLLIHVAREGENIYDATDENGRYFIRQMIRIAQAAEPGQVHFIKYPWRNAVLGELKPRNKVVAYRYFPDWDWIIATGSYVDETYDDTTFERDSLLELKKSIVSKRVGQSGYIFALDTDGNLMIHPELEGENILESVDADGTPFVREMLQEKRGWIRYLWQNPEDPKPRMKIVRYEYFKPWDWVVGVSAYEDEFYQPANQIKWRIVLNMLLLPLIVGAIALALVMAASRLMVEPINRLIAVIRKTARGRFDERAPVESNDELGELAETFNRMAEIIKRNKDIEANLNQQSKMASLGVLSSGVAHEINNPLSVILGYASYLEGKLDKESAHYKYVCEIRRESKRCKKIVQDLLSYARTPRPSLEEVDLNTLLDQIVDFASDHTDMHHVTVEKDFATELPPIQIDGDQIRQVAINLILNAGSAMEEGGKLTVHTRQKDDMIDMVFCDTGCGIPQENLEKIFEPFYTTREVGTGLGLAITKQIVELHMGQISIDSTPGEGTSVTVSLPLVREELG